MVHCKHELKEERKRFAYELLTIKCVWFTYNFNFEEIVNRRFFFYKICVKLLNPILTRSFCQSSYLLNLFVVKRGSS